MNRFYSKRMPVEEKGITSKGKAIASIQKAVAFGKRALLFEERKCVMKSYNCHVCQRCNKSFFVLSFLFIFVMFS